MLYLAWNVYVICLPVTTPMRPITDARPVKDEGCFGVVGVDRSDNGALDRPLLINDEHSHNNNNNNDNV